MATEEDTLDGRPRRLRNDAEIARQADGLGDRCRPADEVRVETNFDDIVGRSATLKRALEMADAVASSRTAVLLRGESGVGKELFARAIHTGSPRAAGPLVTVNCPSIQKDLFESEFFGHVRGSFTGANRDRSGRFETADGGTIFLDEVGEIPLESQAKLLRVLQEGQFERIGDDRTRNVDVRVISATNRDLEKDIQRGIFRRDLYYRLSAFPIAIPPLRERPEDIVLLARHFLAIFIAATGRPSLTLTSAHEEMLTRHDWPGNIRELRHVIERAVILSRTPPLQLEQAMITPGAAAPPQLVPSPRRAGAPLTDVELRQLERQNILAALEHTGGRVAGKGGAADLLGIRPSTLRDRMKAFGIAKRSP